VACSGVNFTFNNNNNNNNRRVGLAKVIHQKLAEAAELIDDRSPYYKYTPANVLENENLKMCWNHSILTDKTINIVDLAQHL
jgi:hypothetical protein